jgi:hypothetical protein
LAAAEHLTTGRVGEPGTGGGPGGEDVRMINVDANDRMAYPLLAARLLGIETR